MLVRLSRPPILLDRTPYIYHHDRLHRLARYEKVPSSYLANKNLSSNAFDPHQFRARRQMFITTSNIDTQGKCEDAVDGTRKGSHSSSNPSPPISHPRISAFLVERMSGEPTIPVLSAKLQCNKSTVPSSAAIAPPRAARFSVNCVRIRVVFPSVYIAPPSVDAWQLVKFESSILRVPKLRTPAPFPA